MDVAPVDGDVTVPVHPVMFVPEMAFSCTPGHRAAMKSVGLRGSPRRLSSLPAPLINFTTRPIDTTKTMRNPAATEDKMIFLFMMELFLISNFQFRTIIQIQDTKLQHTLRKADDISPNIYWGHNLGFSISHKSFHNAC